MKKRPITGKQRAIRRADAARLIAGGYARRIGAGTDGAIWTLTYKGIRAVEAMAAADKAERGKLK